MGIVTEMPSQLQTPEPHEWTMPEYGDDPRWRDAFFAAQLANVTALHIFGKPLLSLKPSLRADIRSFAEGYTEDAADRYAGILDAVLEYRP